MIELAHFQIVAAALFAIGLYGVLSRRSAVLILMSIELMLNAVNVNLIGFVGVRRLCRPESSAWTGHRRIRDHDRRGGASAGARNYLKIVPKPLHGERGRS